MSSWLDHSQISAVNRNGHKEPVPVGPDLYFLVDDARTFYEDTQGAFDITVGPLVALWKQSRADLRLPTEEELAKAKALSGFHHVTLVKEDRAIGFDREGVKLNFGGIGKGFALDKAAGVLRSHGVGTALLHGGSSSIVAIGSPPGEKGWPIPVRHPSIEGETIGEYSLLDESLSTSGISGDSYEIDGVRYGHIIDPRSGLPVSGKAWAMAFAPSATQSDALSTAFYVLAEAEVAAYCEAHENVRATLVYEEKDGSLTTRDLP